MFGSKKFEKVILCLTVAAIAVSLLAVCIPDAFSSVTREKPRAEYPVKLFGQNVIDIEITADENDWSEMLENKMSKPYISCNIKIDGREFKDVGIRPKGNSSLTSIQGDRISYRLDFDHYIDNQTCFGLEQMVLNNLQADATYMKDYIAYDLMAYEGVNAPLHTYAFITLNGEPFGLYLAVEVYDEDYLSRVYDDTDVKLYNVKSSGFDEFENAVVDSETCEVIEHKGIKEVSGMGGMPPPSGQDGGNMPPPPTGGGQMGGGMPPPPEMNGQDFDGGMPPPPGGEGGGGDLVYVDDSTDSYSTIFANTVSKNTGAKDFAKVIRAIKYLNKENVSNEELEQYWDVDSVLRYLAVHTFMVNGDSYTGNMKQNYFLAEQNGRITVLPWDYNLSFGAFGGGPGGPPDMPGMDEQPELGEMLSAIDKTTETINFAIDTPTMEVDVEERPLVSVLLSRDEYKEKYHWFLKELTEYTSGDFINKLEIVEDAIYPYIQRETVSFYSPEEHRAAFEVLKSFLNLRSESIQGQLNGEIPSETALQSEDKLITADFSVSDMGSMGGPGGGPPAPPDMPGGKNSENTDMPGMPPMNDMDKKGGEFAGPPPADMQPMNDRGGMNPPPMPPEGMPSYMANGNAENTEYYITLTVLLLVLCAAFAAAKMFRRKY